MQSERLGSTLKIRARHSAMHAARAGSQLAEPVQLAQPLAGCAPAGHGDTQAINDRTRTTDRNDVRISISAPGEQALRIDRGAGVSAPGLIASPSGRHAALYVRTRAPPRSSTFRIVPNVAVTT
jgi:hypothetical protein